MRSEGIKGDSGKIKLGRQSRKIKLGTLGNLSWPRLRSEGCNSRGVRGKFKKLEENIWK